MATTWNPAPYYKRADWLLLDGTVVPGPQIETTSSSRRWRVAGTTMSVPKHDLDDRVTDFMRDEAKKRGTELWMRLVSDDEEVGDHAYIGTGESTRNILDRAVSANLSANHKISVGFEFKHANYPLRAVLWVALVNQYNRSFSVWTSITYRSSDPGVPDRTTPARRAHWDREVQHSKLSVTAEQITIPEVDGINLCKVAFGANRRKAIAYMLETLLKAQDIDTVTLPDERDPLLKDELEYHFTRTNYSQELYRSLLEQVQEGPALERLGEALGNVRKELAHLGLVVNQEFDLAQLLNGNLHELRVEITPHEDEELTSEGRDTGHTVIIDLARSLCFVQCNFKRLEEVAEQWNVAKFKAELTGQVDELLAYAEAYNLPAEQKRLRKIIEQRAFDPPKQP